MKTGQYPKYRRRNFFIKRHLQGKFVAGFTCFVLAGIILNLLLAYYLIDSRLTEEIYRIHLTVRSTSELAWPVLWKLSLVTVCVGFFAAAGIGYRLTRRVEAPVLDFIGNVRSAAGADFSKRFARAEFNGLEDLRVFYNRMAHSIEKRLCAVQGSAVEMEKSCEKVSRLAAKKALTRADIEELKKELMGVEGAELKARRELARFKV